MSTPFKTFLKFSIGTWLNALISVVSIPIITWFILPDELGKATMFTLAFNLLLNIFLLGQDQSFARHYNEVGAQGRHKLLMNTAAPAVICSLVGLVLIVLFRRQISELLFSTTQFPFYSDLLGLTVLCGVFNRFSQLIVRMRGGAFAFSLLQVISSAINLIGTILYARFAYSDFSAVIIGFVASQLIVVIIGLALERDMWASSLKSPVDRSDARSQLKFGLPFVPTFLFDWLFQSTDRTFLRIYSTFLEIGLYATATRISSALNVIQVGFNTFWVPFVYERYSRDQEDKSFYELVFDCVTLAFSVAVLLILASRQLILLLLPAEYALSIDLFPLVVLVPMLYTLSEISGVGINLKKKTIYHFYILMFSATISVALGFFLIRSYGAKGAIITNFCSYCVFFLFRSVLGARLYRLPINWRKFAVTFAIVLGSVLYSFIWPKTTSYLLLGSCLTAVVLLHIMAIKTAFAHIDIMKWIR